MEVFTSKALARSHRARILCRLSLDSVDVRKAPFHARSCKVLALHSHEAVVGRHSDRLDSGHEAVAGSRPSVGHDEVGRSDLRAGHRSNHEVVECGGGNRRDEGCSHVVGHDDRSSHRLEVDRSHVHGTMANGSGSVRVGEAHRFEAGTVGFCVCRLLV